MTSDRRRWRLLILGITSIALAGLIYSRISLAEAGQGTDSGTRSPAAEPQQIVTCTGWHALCTASPDCQLKGSKADCGCMRVNEAHIVVTSEIQDTAMKRLTGLKCTADHPCDIDRAPVCTAIRDKRYQVDDVRYDWVSTYSYRGWCSLMKVQMKVCDQRAPGYEGDSAWAICDAAPCTEIRNPSDPERPLSCQCRVVGNEPFVGMNGSCKGDGGGIQSSMPVSAWDFQNETYPFPMPGYEYVKGACAPLKTDPLRP